MLHIYRQITALERIRPVVIAQKRENAQSFPFDDVEIDQRTAASRRREAIADRNAAKGQLWRLDGLPAQAAMK